MTSKGSIGVVQKQEFTFAEPPNEMILVSGAKLGPVTVAYETYGTLNEEKSNTILITHAISGDAHVAGRNHEEDRKPGWWDDMVGPGKAFDTDKYFIVCSNVLGGCQGTTGPSSVNQSTGKPYGIDFPVITIADMVNAQKELVHHLGIDTLLCVAGGSMGGMQALEWTTQYSDMVRSAMVIASTHLSGAQQIAFDAVGRNAIQSDENFNQGQYQDGPPPAHGLAIARMLAHITYLSDEGMRTKFGRRLQTAEDFQYEFESEFAVESYLDYQGTQFVNRFDANTYLYVSKAIDYFDISSRYDSLDAAMKEIDSKMLVLSYSSDWLYPPYQSEEMVYSLARHSKDVSYCNIESEYGHDAFLLEVETMEKIVSGFLDNVYDPNRFDKLVIDSAVRQSADSHLIMHNGEHRIDYEHIVELIEQNSRVLDIGCGDGYLLNQLQERKNVNGMGLEIDEKNVVKAIQNGISVVHANIDDGLGALPDQSFDYITFSRTLQIVKKPEDVLKEMLRVGKKCIVTFPNFAYWRARSMSFFFGKSPVTENLPFSWHNTPNRTYFSIKDFKTLCDELGITIEREVYFTQNGKVSVLPNLLAEDALMVITSNTADLKGISQG
jgi:homoserine O-acetyltransferase